MKTTTTKDQLSYNATTTIKREHRSTCWIHQSKQTAGGVVKKSHMTFGTLLIASNTEAVLALFDHPSRKQNIQSASLPWITLTQPREEQSQLLLTPSAEDTLDDSTALLTEHWTLISDWMICRTQAFLITQSAPSRFLGATPLSCSRTMDLWGTSILSQVWSLRN